MWAQLSEIWDPTGEYIKKFEDSFSSKPQAETTTLETNLVLDNRFGDSSKVEVAKPTDSKPYPPPTIPVTNTNPPPSTTSTSTSTSTTTSTTTRASTTSKIPELTTKTAYTPLTVTYGVNRFPNPVDLVSLRPNVAVKGLVRNLGSIGSKVIQAGTRIADMLISTVQTVVGH